ncbi:hypothetical protein EST38_g10657 [Candolleomyces aberdarensis]|uniref:Uncharacterized protein n=1 Tax=Candolleomyces aberdarensis TaxID=2316362 RepID=A0A4V1Q2I4_9AGAR|nr:hypothetical protein EST38_g10657 [Candolleomyces aberdarensis]
MHKHLQDYVLKKYYVDTLPRLRLGCIVSWSGQEGSGMVKFADWGKKCPNMKFMSCISIIKFRSSGRYINLCRISPLDVLVKEIVPSSVPKYHLYGLDRRHIICLAPKKLIRGVYHSQEWERFVGFICTAFDQEELEAQLYQDAIEFSTRPASSQGASSGLPTKAESMYTNTSSPSIKLKRTFVQATPADPFVLACEDTIPVYDCRAVAVNFNTDLDRLNTYP